MLEDVIRMWGGCEVSAMDVYRDMFRFGEDYIQKENEPKGFYKANPIAYLRNEGAEHGRYLVMFEDKFEELLPELQEADFCIINGISYFGRKNVQKHASKMFAMIFDLDGVTDTTLNNFLNAAYVVDAYPIPNYIALSGHGLHLYYLFEEPIPLFPNIKIQLKELKYALTDRIWNSYTSINKCRQKQGINQGFRVIGGKTKKDAPAQRVRAFRVNTHPFNLKQLSEYVPDSFKVDERKLFRESKMSLEEARKRFPEWYERVVVNKEKHFKTRWKIEEKVHGKNPYALYDWWKEQIWLGAAYTHRYFCVMCLAIYGVKCNVPEEQVREDAYALIPFMNELNPAQPFTVSDVDSALECYDLRYCTFPVKDIETISGISIKRNKRNGRPQKMHMKIMSSTRDILYPEGAWRKNAGRPSGAGSKEEIVRQYLKDHPEATVTEAARALGVSRPTIYKYSKPEKIIKENRIEEKSAYDQERLERLRLYYEKLSKL